MTAILTAIILADDMRLEPLLEPGISLSRNLETRLLEGCVRTIAWSTPDDEITLETALRFNGLDPMFWVDRHITAYLWEDPAQGGNVIAYEIQLAESDGWAALGEAA